MNTTDAGSTATRPRPNWVEIVTTILLSLATVASAWSAYQSARWSGEQTKENRSAGAFRTESTRESGLANQQLAIDVGLFTTWLDAVATEQDELADFYRERFPDRLDVAVEAWAAPFEATGEVPDGSPFDLDSYVLEPALEAERLVAEAEAAADRSDENNQRADNFVLTAVLYASVLFFAGIASKMNGWYSQRIAAALGIVLFVAATSVLVSLPWNVGF
ncbi:MAG TPA: hypothetical protein VK866_16465 [Acidimicrobiales bacterium]|nr:hypothetical protein [Acidimicrobiales bacterium]